MKNVWSAQVILYIINELSDLRYLVKLASFLRLMLLSKVNDMCRLVQRFAKVVYVEVLAFVDHEEFAHPAHKPFVVGI